MIAPVAAADAAGQRVTATESKAEQGIANDVIGYITDTVKFMTQAQTRECAGIKTAPAIARTGWSRQLSQERSTLKYNLGQWKSLDDWDKGLAPLASGPAATRAYQDPVAAIDVLSASTQFVFGIRTWMKLSLDALSSQYQTFGQLDCSDDDAVTAGKHKARAVDNIATGFTELNKAIAAEP
jgi:hypothetical protein